MSSQNVEIVRRVFDVFGARGMTERDFARAAEFFDPDVEFARVGQEFGDLAGEWRGRSEMIAALIQFRQAWEGLRTQPERFIDLGDRVLVLVKQTGRGLRSGVLVEHDAAALFVLRDGRIIRWEGYWDRARARRVAALDE